MKQDKLEILRSDLIFLYNEYKKLKTNQNRIDFFRRINPIYNLELLILIALDEGNLSYLDIANRLEKSIFCIRRTVKKLYYSRLVKKDRITKGIITSIRVTSLVADS